jgi:single-stranded-DNA-specific exonuclease
MAAGLTLADGQHLPAFAAALADAVLAQTGGLAPDDALDSDGPLDAATLTLELAQRLQQAGPWGQGFPSPLFDDVFTLHEARIVGADHLRLRLSLPGGTPLNAIAWGAAPLRGQLTASLRVAYEPQVNSWRGMRELQLLVRGLSPA